MKRPLKEIRLFGPFADFSSVIGSRKVGSSPADKFDGMFESFTIVLEYNLKSSTMIREDDIAEEGFRLEDVLNDYLFSSGSNILYFMRGEVPHDADYEATMLFGIDGDIWEGRLDREGKNEGSIGGTEDVVNANLEIDGATVADSYMFIYPTEKAKKIQETGSYS